MDFNPETGVLYASWHSGSGGSGPSFLATVDVTTGVVTNVGQSVDGLDAIAWQPNTPPGMNVVVTPDDATTGQPSPVALTFANVTQSGGTTVASSGPGGGPPLPTQFTLGDPATIFDIETTATFTGPVELCFDYSGVTYGDENALELLHFDGADWVDVTTSLDTGADIICGSVTSLSPFAVVHALTETVQAILDDVLALEGLPGNVAGSLARKLNNALASLDRGNMNAAVNQLQAFINQIEALVLSGSLVQPDVDEIIGLAQFVIDELGG